MFVTMKPPSIEASCEEVEAVLGGEQKVNNHPGDFVPKPAHIRQTGMVDHRPTDGQTHLTGARTYRQTDKCIVQELEPTDRRTNASYRSWDPLTDRQRHPIGAGTGTWLEGLPTLGRSD